MLPFVAAALLAANPAPIQVATLGFQGVGMPEDKAALFTDYFAEKLSNQGGIRVVTPGDIASVLGMERQKQLLGCADNAASCLAELSGALGAEALVTGKVARLGDTFVVTIRIIDSTSGSPIATESGEVPAEAGVLGFLKESAARCANVLRAKYRPGLVDVPGAFIERHEREPGVRRFAWIPASVAGLAAIGSSVTFAMAKGAQGQLERANPELDRERALQVSATGRSQQTASFALLMAAVATGGVAAGMYAFGAPPDASASIAPIANGSGAALVFSGSLQ